jgi:hypothetical protein
VSSFGLLKVANRLHRKAVRPGSKG